MERIIITIDDEHAEIKAEAVSQLVAQQIAEKGITGTNVYIEQQLQVMPFMSGGRRGGIYG